MISCFLCIKFGSKHPPRTYSNINKFLKHIRRAHHGRKLKEFKCLRCESSYSNIFIFDNHIRRCYNYLNCEKKRIHTTLVSGINNASSALVSEDINLLSPVTSSGNNQTNIIENYQLSPEKCCDDQEEWSSWDDEVETRLSSLTLDFSLELLANPHFTRQDAFDIQASVTTLFSKMINIIRSQTEKEVEKLSSKLEDMFDLFSSPFHEIRSEYHVKKCLKQKNLTSDYTEFIIDDSVGVVFKEGTSKMERIKHTGVVMPIEFQINEFLKRGNRLSEMIDNYNNAMCSDNSVIKHIVQCKTWKKMLQKANAKPGTIFLPMTLYSDGMQYNNPLGAHLEQAEMLYYAFPCLSDPLNDLNTFLAAVIMTKDVKSFGNGKCFAPLVENFDRLYKKGIEIDLNGKIVKVKFLLANITGDNAALNAILDYMKGFNANIFCRICLCTIQETITLPYEQADKLRTEENYLEGLKIDDPKKTGIAEDCVFNALEYFHCVENKSLDLMHDVFEGYSHNDLTNFILRLNDDKIMSFREFNRRLSDFSYGKEDVQYIPSIIEREKIKKGILKLTAREMWQFIYLFPIVIGDIIPENYEPWEMILCMIEIVDILLGSSFYPEILEHLKRKVSRHHFLYNKHFGKLTPKMHFATHLRTSIEAMGPPRFYMCFRLEAKHRYFKIYAHVSNSRKNTPVSFARKYSLYFANFLHKNSQCSDISVNLKHEKASSHPQLLEPEYKCYSKIDYKGSEYESTKFVPMSNKLYEILEIFVEHKNVKFVCKHVGNLNYNQHLVSYEVNRVEGNVELIPFENVKSQALYIYKMFDGREVIRPKNFFTN